MNFKFIRKGIALATIVGAVLIPCKEAVAAEAKQSLRLSKTQIECVLNREYLIQVTEKVEQCIEEVKGEYYEMAFARSEAGDFLYVRNEASEESDWNGKLYAEGAAKVLENTGEWIKIESANVTGYVRAENLVIMKEADIKAKEILAAKNPDVDITTLDEETVKNSFSYAESKEEEAARLEREAAERLQRGQEVVDFAMQFVGNPYVWGGTSLTNGADCSGFVKAVYAHFGIGLPHSSSALRGVGRGVSYNEAMPGDVICYQGHVGIYMGNGMIVNAIDDAHGIGVSSATYSGIITVRRLR